MENFEDIIKKKFLEEGENIFEETEEEDIDLIEEEIEELNNITKKIQHPFSRTMPEAPNL